MTQFNSVNIRRTPTYFQRAKAADLIFLVNLLRRPGQNFTQSFSISSYFWATSKNNWSSSFLGNNLWPSLPFRVHLEGHCSVLVLPPWWNPLFTQFVFTVFPNSYLQFFPIHVQGIFQFIFIIFPNSLLSRFLARAIAHLFSESLNSMRTPNFTRCGTCGDPPCLWWFFINEN